MIQSILGTSINWWAVFTAAVSTMVVGYLWYGPLFGRAWGQLTGWTSEKIKTLTAVALARQYGFTFVLAFVMSTTMAYVLGLGALGWLDGLLVALVFGMGFVVTSVGTIYLFERQPMTLFLINVGYRLALMVVAASILTVWK